MLIYTSLKAFGQTIVREPPKRKAAADPSNARLSSQQPFCAQEASGTRQDAIVTPIGSENLTVGADLYHAIEGQLQRPRSKVHHSVVIHVVGPGYALQKKM
jgi:hypothetical protein